MAYAKKFAMPAAFPEVLKDFTREVLRSQPESIYSFGAEYFGKLAAVEGGAPAGAIEHFTKDELQTMVTDLFLEADADRNGTLSRSEMVGLFSKLREHLQLDDRDVMILLADADENDDGGFGCYREFGVAARQG